MHAVNLIKFFNNSLFKNFELLEYWELYYNGTFIMTNEKSKDIRTTYTREYSAGYGCQMAGTSDHLRS
jgi:hypothetical protein